MFFLWLIIADQMSDLFICMLYEIAHIRMDGWALHCIVYNELTGMFRNTCVLTKKKRKNGVDIMGRLCYKKDE